MATIFVIYEVPDSCKEFFTTHDFKPFEHLALTIKVDRDSVTTLLQETVQEAKYQIQRDNETLKSVL